MSEHHQTTPKPKTDWFSVRLDRAVQRVRDAAPAVPKRAPDEAIRAIAEFMKGQK